MTNLKNEFVGIYAPIFYLFTTFFAQQFAQCVTQPITSEITGPSGSSMMCLGAFLVNVVLWLPAGVICIILQIRRSRVLGGEKRFDLLRHNVAAAIGLMLLVITAKSIQDITELWAIVTIAGVLNFGICGFFFVIGCCLRCYKPEAASAPNISHRVRIQTPFPVVSRPSQISETEQDASGNRR